MVRSCWSWSDCTSTICRSVSGIGTFSTRVSPRATSRSFTFVMTSSTSSTSWSPWTVTAPVPSPVRTRCSACCALMLTCSHSSANSSEAMKARTSRSTRLLIAADRGPTSCSSRGRSVITPSKTFVEDGLDVDLLLDGGRHLGGDGVLHLGRVDQRIHGRDVPLGVVQGALTPVRDARGRGQQPGQHQAEDRRDRTSPRRSPGGRQGLHRRGGRVRWRELRHGFSVERAEGLDRGRAASDSNVDRRPHR